MKSTKNSIHIQRAVNKLMKQFPIIPEVLKKIMALKGHVYIVGGAVRDILLKQLIKDLDIEVHGIPLEKLQAILKQSGPIRLVGKTFGVLRVDGIDIDWSIPRSDAAGRKPKVELDPYMPIKKAFARRDLTINAMGIDLQTKELVDPFNGLKDLKQRRLKAPDTKFFKEDPLRLFRVMQFVSRFEATPNVALNAICKKMDISKVSKERIEQEFNKMLLRSKNPSLGLRWLRKIKRLKEILPELHALIGIKQGKDWHPEGDVFEHTMQSIDAVDRLSIKDLQTKLILMYAALCHDLGKAKTSKKRKDGTITSYGHDEEGVALAKKMLKRITNNVALIKAVTKLVRYHMAPLQFYDNKAKAPAYKRLANKLAPEVTMQMLADLALADRQGRNGKGHQPLTKKDWKDIADFRKKAQKFNIIASIEHPILQGRDLLDVVKPGPELGKLVRKAYQIQLDEGITDKNELRRRVLTEL